MEAINREVAEVEEILNAGDDYEPAGEAVQSGGGSGDDDKPAAVDEAQAADCCSPAEPEAAPEPPIEPSIGTPDGTPTAPPAELPADAGRRRRRRRRSRWGRATRPALDSWGVGGG